MFKSILFRNVFFRYIWPTCMSGIVRATVFFSEAHLAAEHCSGFRVQGFGV